MFASDFANLPQPHGPIVAWNFRADRSQKESIDWGWGNETMLMSTTDKPSLTTDFEDNHGPNKKVVHDGPFPFHLLGIGPSEGPRDIADGTRLKTPFYYDPSQGNLLIERLIYTNAPSKQATLDLLVTAEAQALYTEDGLDSPKGTLAFNTPVFQFEFAEAGDFDGSDGLDSHDIDQLSEAVNNNSTDRMYDVNLDSKVDSADRIVWVEQLKRTYFGDADLDGEFRSNDFIVVLSAGEYEDGVALNSHWATGDWDGNREFDSGDIVMALQNGGYEAGPRQAVAAVPEPGGVAILGCGLLLASGVMRRGRSRVRGSVVDAKDPSRWLPPSSISLVRPSEE